MDAPGAVLDQDQRVDPLEQDGVYVDEVEREDPVSLRGQELAPGRAGSARSGVDSRVVEDLPDGGGGDRVVRR